MRLLFVGRSLNELREMQSPYRLSQNMLPKFNIERKPGFAGIKNCQNYAPSSVAQVSSGSERKSVRVEGNAQEKIRNFCKRFVAAAKTFRSSANRAAQPDLFGMRPGNGILEKKSSRPPVIQAELSLEKVKVLRNDLSDADLEVVTAKSARHARVIKNQMNGFDSSPSSVRIGRWFGDLLKAEETEVP